MKQKPYRDAIAYRQKWTILALLCLGALLSGCKKSDEAPSPEVSVQAEKVESRDLTEFVSGETVLVPVSQAAIVPKISAPIKRF